MSKCLTIELLEKKICRLLSGYLYMVLKNKSVIVSSIRLWRANNLDELAGLDSNYTNYTSVKVDATVLNISKI